jgi:hypothetical protein
LPEDISPIQILRNKRSGQGWPRSSGKMLTCSQYKRKLFQPGKQASKKVKRESRSAGVQAEVVEENGNQAEDVIGIYCRG